MNYSQLTPLEPEVFKGRGIDIARELIGKFLVNRENGCGGIIVETEAYMGENDPSCHFARSQNGGRADTFRKGAGTVYVYRIHTHNCMNFISEYRGKPEGILIRALEPVEGIEEMRERRGFEDEEKLCSGPGKLTEALGIEKKKHNGQKLGESSISVFRAGNKPEVEVSSRIGISEAEDWPARFSVTGNPHVSEAPGKVDSSFDHERHYRELENL